MDVDLSALQAGPVTAGRDERIEQRNLILPTGAREDRRLERRRDPERRPRTIKEMNGCPSRPCRPARSISETWRTCATASPTKQHSPSRRRSAVLLTILKYGVLDARHVVGLTKSRIWQDCAGPVQTTLDDPSCASGGRREGDPAGSSDRADDPAVLGLAQRVNHRRSFRRRHSPRSASSALGDHRKLTLGGLALAQQGILVVRPWRS